METKWLENHQIESLESHALQTSRLVFSKQGARLLPVLVVWREEASMTRLEWLVPDNLGRDSTEPRGSLQCSPGAQQLLPLIKPLPLSLVKEDHFLYRLDFLLVRLDHFLRSIKKDTMIEVPATNQGETFESLSYSEVHTRTCDLFPWRKFKIAHLWENLRLLHIKLRHLFEKSEILSQ